MKYRRLTRDDRYQIQALLDSGQSIRAIARQLNRSPSTLSREKRKSEGIYQANVAHETTSFRRRGRYETRYKIRGSLENYVRQKILIDWSPQQIAGRKLRLNHKDQISHQTIYRYLERDKLSGGVLWRHLRILRKQRHDRKKPQWRPQSQLFTPRPSIENRPKIVEQRSRLGDYERDTVYGAKNGRLLLTIVDRTSRLTKIACVEKKSCDLIHQATVNRLKNEEVLTITNDNGSEFYRYQDTEKELGTAIFFSRSYRSWERGTNENTNGLIRQYFPRKTPILRRQITYVQLVENRLNNRPRKCLGFNTPNEVHRQLRSSVLR